MTWFAGLVRSSASKWLLGNERAIANARIVLEQRQEERRSVDLLVGRLGDDPSPARPSTAA